jgi:hypothetical protein
MMKGDLLIPSEAAHGTYNVVRRKYTEEERQVL